MKGIVVENRKRKSAVLCEDGTVSLVNGIFPIGSTVDISCKKKTHAMWYKMAMACMVLMMTVAGIHRYQYTVLAYGYALVDGTSSYELTLNKKGDVIQVEALNENGESNLEEVVKNTMHHHVSDAISSISDNEEILKVNVTSEDRAYAQDISDKVRNNTKKEIESSSSSIEEYDHAKEFVRNKDKPAEECPEMQMEEPLKKPEEHMEQGNPQTPPQPQLPDQKPLENSR